MSRRRAHRDARISARVHSHYDSPHPPVPSGVHLHPLPSGRGTRPMVGTNPCEPPGARLRDDRVSRRRGIRRRQTALMTMTAPWPSVASSTGPLPVTAASRQQFSFRALPRPTGSACSRGARSPPRAGPGAASVGLSAPRSHHPRPDHGPERRLRRWRQPRSSYWRRSARGAAAYGLVTAARVVPIRRARQALSLRRPAAGAGRTHCRARCLIRAVSSWTCSNVLRRCAISLRIFLSACMTVVWSRPPNVWPMRGSERSVSSRHRYMAI